MRPESSPESPHHVIEVHVWSSNSRLAICLEVPRQYQKDTSRLSNVAVIGPGHPVALLHSHEPCRLSTAGCSTVLLETFHSKAFQDAPPNCGTRRGGRIHSGRRSFAEVKGSTSRRRLHSASSRNLDRKVGEGTNSRKQAETGAESGFCRLRRAVVPRTSTGYHLGLLISSFLSFRGTYVVSSFPQKKLSNKGRDMS
jgi:hypothetical protein